MDVNTCLFLYLPSCALFSLLVLVQFTFGKAKFVPDFDDENFGLILIEDDGPAYRFVLLYL
jgi:hypothetical protein